MGFIAVRKEDFRRCSNVFSERLLSCIVYGRMFYKLEQQNPKLHCSIDVCTFGRWVDISIHFHLFPMLSVSLSNFITIQPFILAFGSFSFFLHFCSILCIYSLYRILLTVCLSRIVLFSLMTTRLNKYYCNVDRNRG